MTEPLEALTLNESGSLWNGPALNAAQITQIQEIVKANPRSLIKEDQVKQKQLLWDLAKIMKSFKRTGDARHWAEFITRINGPRPFNPIFTNFLNVHEPVDVDNEDKWKMWEFSIPKPVGIGGSTDETPSLDHNRFEPTRQIVVQRDKEEVDYETESDV